MMTQYEVSHRNKVKVFTNLEDATKHADVLEKLGYLCTITKILK